MLNFVFPDYINKSDVQFFYNEFEKYNEQCIGINNYKNYDVWLMEMRNRHTGMNLPKGYVREDFYLCYENKRLVGVFSLKYELTEYLMNYGGNIGYAVRPDARKRGLANQILKQGLVIAKKAGLSKILCVCDDDNIPSRKVIIKNGGIFENCLYDPYDKVNVERYWISDTTMKTTDIQ